jgi:DNA-binding IclR family transcriptional regulator
VKLLFRQGQASGLEELAEETGISSDTVYYYLQVRVDRGLSNPRRYRG